MVASGEEISKDALGFHIPKRFEKVLPIKKCYLQGDPSNAIRDFFTDYAHKSSLPFYDHVVHKGFFRNVMIRTTSTGEVMVVLQIADDSVEKIDNVLNDFIEKFP